MKYVIIGLFSLLCFASSAQDTSSQKLRTQFSLMIVPYAKSGEDIRTKIESDFAYRAIISEIGKAFQERGFTVDNFETALQNVLNDQVGNATLTQTDLWKKIQELAPAEIFLNAEIDVYKSGSGNKVSLILKAVDKYTNGEYANSGLLQSNLMHTEDFAKLAQLALQKDQAIEKFLNALDVKFKDISENGRSVEVKIELLQSSPLSLSDEIGSDYDLLSELIIDWVKKNSFKNVYRVKSTTAKLLWFDQIKIPIKNVDGSQYRPEDFARSFRKYLRNLGKKTKAGELTVPEPIVRSSKILFNIQ